jgi:hypothetical protein
MATTRKTRTPGDAPVRAEADALQAVEVEQADDGLPNAIDVDARAITGPVLTRQGYVCPDEQWQKNNPTEFAALRAARG